MKSLARSLAGHRPATRRDRALLVTLGILSASLLAWGPACAQSIPLPPSAPQKSKNLPPPASSVPSIFSGIPFLNNVRPPASPFSESQRLLIDRVSNYLSNIRTLVGDFNQVGPDGSKTQGQFYLQKPGRLRFEYDDPSPIQLIADGSSVVVRDRKLATQDLYPLSQTPLRFLLADRVDLLRDTNVVAVFTDDVFSTVVIDEKQTLGGTHRLMLMFDAKTLTLKQWTVTDPQGYDTTVALSNLDTTKRPDPGMFKINYERMIQ
ncbi:MAG: outer membrane lipoprotein carrier protein LolA [Pseudorhodoplanes sp.]